jgi:UDP-N-acetylglucosamine 4,6-dehydratase
LKVLITGGTGSFGKSFIETILEKYPLIERLVIFSRDELKQWEMQQKYPTSKFPQLRFFIGDIRDRPRLTRALENIDYVVHAAALKHVPAAEYNPIEFIRTNVLGSENLIQACLDNKVKKLIALSTDKACAPINLYGATKLCADKLFIAANNITGSRELVFSIVRYGNVMGSRGSVIPFFLKEAHKGYLPITDNSMTRFNILLKEGVELVLWAIENAIGSEIFVPKIPSYRITDVAEAILPGGIRKQIGIRPGEKLHEEMINPNDSSSTLDLGKVYAILPSNNHSFINNYLNSNSSFKKVPNDFSYNSLDNEKYLSIREIQQLIKENIDSDFKPIIL